MTAHPTSHVEAELILARAAECAGTTLPELRRRWADGTLTDQRLCDLMALWGDS